MESRFLKKSRLLDLEASQNMLQLQMAKLNKAITAQAWPEACASLRALRDECDNATQIAGSLGLSAHIDAKRFPVRSGT